MVQTIHINFAFVCILVLCTYVFNMHFGLNTIYFIHNNTLTCVNMFLICSLGLNIIYFIRNNTLTCVHMFLICSFGLNTIYFIRNNTLTRSLTTNPITDAVSSRYHPSESFVWPENNFM